MATPATSTSFITVEKLVVNQTEGVLTVESAQQGLKSFNANCQEKPMPFEEFVSIVLMLQGFGATDITATLQPLTPGARKLTWTLKAATR